MVKYPQMKFAALILLSLLSSSALAAARVVVPSLPEAATADAEVSTNFPLTVNAARLERLTIAVSVDSCETNEVLVALGVYKDAIDGLLTKPGAGYIGTGPPVN